MTETLIIIKKKKIYAPPKQLFDAYEKSIDAGKCTDNLLKLFQKIARNFATKFRYINKCDEDACVSYAVTEAWLKWGSFNPEKSDNIFSFYTTMIANDLMAYYNKSNKGKKNLISLETLFSNENN